MIGASPARQRVLSVVARETDEAHEHVRDRATAPFGLTSSTELSSDPARQLIDVCQRLLNLPAAPAIARFHVGNLPKRVAAKPAAEPSKPVTAPTLAAARGAGGIGRHSTVPAAPKPKPAPFKFDPRLNVAADDLDKIPW
jgi:hypothetical protein